MYDDDEDDIPLMPPPAKKDKPSETVQMQFLPTQLQLAQKKNALQAAAAKLSQKPKQRATAPPPVIDLSSRNKQHAPISASGFTYSNPAATLRTIRANPVADNFSFLPKAATDDSFMLFGEILIQNEYQLAVPNDYEKLSKEIKERKAREKAAKEIAKRLSREHKEEEAKRSKGAAIAPPQALLEPPPPVETKPALVASSSAMPPPSFLPAFGKATSRGLGVAANIMSRMGYREGGGLGKTEQGMRSALQVERKGKDGGVIIADQREDLPPPQQPVNMADAVRNQSKVVCLANMISLSEVDSEFEDEVKEEMGKYGQVATVIVHKRESVPEEQQVRVFVEFTNVAQAMRAFIVMNGRYFGGRSVIAKFYNYDDFMNKDYDN